MIELTVRRLPTKDYSTWLGCRVHPSPQYPDRVFLAGTATGLIALEACHDDCFWAAKVRVDKFEGWAMARSRAEARANAERKLLEAMSKDPQGLLWIKALNLFVVMNPSLITGAVKCLN
jgi:hypothetical protein